MRKILFSFFILMIVGANGRYRPSAKCARECRGLRPRPLLKIIFSICILLSTALPAFANNLVLSNATLEDRNKTANTVVVQFNISWDHSWRKNDGRHDSVWVFAKILQNSTAPWIHGKMYTAGTNPVNTSPGTNSDVKIIVPSDKMGAFIERTASASGSYESQKVRLTIDYGSSGIADTDTIQVKLYGIEMIYIPEGPFYVGDGTSANAQEVPGVNALVDTFISVFKSGSTSFDYSGTQGWAKRLGSTFISQGYGLANDTSNDIIATGFLSGSGDLNGDGDITDTNETGNTGVYAGNDIYISVFNSSGTFQWSKRLGGTGNDAGNSAASDLAGDIIITGSITGNTDLNGDGDTADTNETGNTGVYAGTDAFVSVFNSSGTFQWAKRLGGTTSNDIGYSVVTNSLGNIFMAGQVSGNVDLNGNGASSDTNETGNTGVLGGIDAFISVFNSAGTYQWSKRLGGTSSDNVLGTAIDRSDNFIVVGQVGQNGDLNGNGTTSDTNETGQTGVYASGDAYVSVFNSAGTFQWCKRIGGTAADIAYAVHADSAYNVIVAGFVNGPADLNGNGTTSDTNENGNTGVYGGQDVFISVFNSAGSFQWSKRLGGTLTDKAYSVSTDSSNDVIVTGTVNGNADLNGDGNTTGTNETGNTGIFYGDDGFISVFNSVGTFLWSKRLGGTINDLSSCVTVDSANDIAVIGTVASNCDLNGDGVISTDYSLYQVGAISSAAQITTTGASITCKPDTNDDLSSSPTTVTGLSGITGNTSWPNGYGAFYAMKYEITQGQYVDFLNTLSRVQQGNRVAATVSGNTIANYYVMTNGTSVTARQGIRAPASGNGTTPTAVVFGNDLSANGTFNETDDGQALAMNYMSWMDLAAYADWAALRPMTEMEYEKITNGPTSPNYGQGAWATTTITTVTSVSNGGRTNETAGQTGEGLSNYNSGGSGGPMRVGYAATSATNRKSAGAGYYGNMNMSDNVLERVVTLGRSTGRSFTGTHGDGTVNTTASYEGNATNNDWPGIDGTTNKGVTGASGTGFKGGGYTSSAQYMYTADRTSVSITDSGRGAAYGGRLVRTAP